LKKRGINVATFNDAQSDEVHVEILMLCLLYAILQMLIFVMCCDKVAVKKKVSAPVSGHEVTSHEVDNEVLGNEPIDLLEDDDDENLSYYHNGYSRNLNEIEVGYDNDDDGNNARFTSNILNTRIREAPVDSDVEV